MAIQPVMYHPEGYVPPPPLGYNEHGYDDQQPPIVLPPPVPRPLNLPPPIPPQYSHRYTPPGQSSRMPEPSEGHVYPSTAALYSPVAAANPPSSISGDGKSHAKKGEKKKPSHACWMCHKSFDRPSTLRKHLLVHTGEKCS